MVNIEGITLRNHSIGSGSGRYKLALLGAGRANLGLAKCAKRMGIQLSVLTEYRDEKYPCLLYADKIIECDITDINWVLSSLRKYDIDGVVSTCSDTPLLAQAYLVAEKNLIGPSVFTAEACVSKKLLKEKLNDQKVNTPKAFIIDENSTDQDIVNNLQLPVIAKPIVGQGSAGVEILDTVEEISNWRNTHPSEKWVVEEYLDISYEFGAQAFLADGEIIFIEFHNDEVLSKNNPIPVLHSFPFKHTSIMEDARIQAVNAINALKITTGAVNIDFAYSKGEIYVIEITNRAGANGLVESISSRFGIDYNELIIREALGLGVEELWRNRCDPQPAIAVRMLYSNDRKKITRVRVTGETPNSNLTSFLTTMTTVSAPTSSNDYVGQLLVHGDTLEEVEAELQVLLEKVEYE
ncbi:ATP-grasp domain-containing protein [Corynebacterium sp. 3HC-13]|uniref:ATP-grasp domain-containing protein n=1 Tax=Corynebacterium poyangense TaxID=2684405 RepID=UPI001CCDF46B|nr:ATP-grasp domain-containing protein [Corynebacterium poyangense]MBZ8177036.1 ATP-grasp domain-containing protein [Corynebacterium poyangense]